MEWTLMMKMELQGAQFPATKEDLLDYGERNGVSPDLMSNLMELPDDQQEYQSIDELWGEMAELDYFLYEDENE